MYDQHSTTNKNLIETKTKHKRFNFYCLAWNPDKTVFNNNIVLQNSNAHKANNFITSLLKEE